MKISTLERRDEDFVVDGYDLLADAFNEAELEEEQIVTGVKYYLGSFLEPRHMEVFERTLESGSANLNDTDQRLWGKIKWGILRHPAVIGSIAIALGKDSVVETGENVWLEEASCNGDVRFVEPATLIRKNESELRNICESCPVLGACRQEAESIVLEKGFRAGQLYKDKQ